MEDVYVLIIFDYDGEIDSITAFRTDELAKEYAKVLDYAGFTIECLPVHNKNPAVGGPNVR